jgi:hypothetical protein
MWRLTVRSTGEVDMSAWKRRANEVATRMKGAPEDDILKALYIAKEQAHVEGVTFMGTDDDMRRYAHLISKGSFRFN